MSSTEFPTRVSKIMHRHNKAIAVMITNKLKSTNPDNPSDLSKLVGWLNGVATPEKNPDMKREIMNLRSTVQHYGSNK